MAWVIYNRGKFNFGKFDMTATSLGMLVLAGASLPAGATNPDLNTITELLAVSGVVEAAVAGYTRKTLSGVGFAEDDVNDRAALTWTAPVWSAMPAGETWRAVVLYIVSNSELIGIDDTADTATSGVDITYNGGSIRVV